jgi:hypothetical protein
MIVWSVLAAANMDVGIPGLGFIVVLPIGCFCLGDTFIIFG